MPIEDRLEVVAWDLPLAYRMVRQRDHALTDRQRSLQSEQENLSKALDQLRMRIEKLTNALELVRLAGSDTTDLKAQINAVQAEVARIEPRHNYLRKATSIIAANLRLLHQAHEALHLLSFENGNLDELDKRHEVPKVTLTKAAT